MAYTSGDILIRAVMTASTGLPQDAVINDFAFQKASAVTNADFANAAAAVDRFYNGTTPSSFKVHEYISNYVSRAATHELQGWQIHAGPLGSPDYSSDWLGPSVANGTTGLPSEVAGVLSYHALLTGILEEEGSTRPRARRRGRIFVGPLTNEAINNTSPPYRLKSTFLTTLRQAAILMRDEAAADGLTWCVWSRKDSTLRPVVGGWTDDAPDTQRRRGPGSTARVAYSV